MSYILYSEAYSTGQVFLVFFLKQYDATHINGNIKILMT
jgi:hypothetical protein